MNAIGRTTLCLGLLSTGFAGQAGLDALCTIERPPLRRPLTSLPMEIGGWSGRDEEMDKDILRISEASEYLNRTYTNPKFPGVGLSLWVNYSRVGNNMHHSPTGCLPAHGNHLVESKSSLEEILAPGGEMVTISRLAYAPEDPNHGEVQEELVEKIGFWYYVFGEGMIEQWVRGLPVSSRSSHGRTTRGSGLTVEVFWRSEADPDSLAFRDFASGLLAELDPIMPTNRAGYYVP
jgi:hypothetical protein